MSELGESPVALTIFGLTIITSLLAFQREDLLRLFILHPWSLVREKRYYTFLASGLIHADLGHLFVNMITFYCFAFTLEGIVGHVQFAAIYLVSLVVSDISTVVRHRNDPGYYCLGASGAITAVLFAFIIYRPFSVIYLFFVIPIPAPLFAVLYVAYSYYAAKHQQDRINHAAHLWGAISGLVLVLLLDPGAYRECLDKLARWVG